MAMPTSFKHDDNRPNVSIGPKVGFFLKFVCFLYIDYYFKGYIYVVKAWEGFGDGNKALMMSLASFGP
jgi:hypothetical protein